MSKKNFGNFGEKIATEYLIKKGYLILEKNWHYGSREIDIIVYKKIAIGVEVKIRSCFGPPYTILKAGQLARLRSVLNNYCQLNDLSYDTSRLDLITIEVVNKKTLKLRHHLDI